MPKVCINNSKIHDGFYYTCSLRTRDAATKTRRVSSSFKKISNDQPMGVDDRSPDSKQGSLPRFESRATI